MLNNANAIPNGSDKKSRIADCNPALIILYPKGYLI